MDEQPEETPLNPPPPNARHYRESSYREMIVETLFLGSLLQHLWKVGAPSAEVLFAMRDMAGYDLTIECNSVIRYIQLKGMVAPRQVRVNTRLAKKPGFCVIGAVVEPRTLEVQHYRWFDGEKKNGALSVDELPNAMSLKYNRHGKRVLLPDTKVIPVSSLKKIESIAELANRLFRLN